MTIPAALALIKASLADVNDGIVGFSARLGTDCEELKNESQDVYYTAADNYQRSLRIGVDCENLVAAADAGALLRTLGLIRTNVLRYNRESAEYMRLNSILRMLGMKNGK